MRTCHIFILIALSIAFVFASDADYYAILGIPRDADDKQIKLAYKQLSKKFHPDKNPLQEAHEKFLKIGEAYEVLSDPEKKSNYDTYGSAEGRGQENVDFGDIFNHFFGGGFGFGGHQRQQRRKPRGADARVNLNLELKDFYNGKELDFDVEMQNVCSKCQGSGSRDGKRKECGKCHGRGILQIQRQLGPGMIQTFNTHCDHCGGRGTVIEHACGSCQGSGTIRSERHYEVYMRPGSDRDSTHVLQGEGDQSPEWDAGDLIVNFVEDLSKSWGYRRVGNNLYRTEVLTAHEALRGGWKRLIPFFDSIDNTIELSRPAGRVVEPDEIELVKGHGMPIHEDDSHAHNDDDAHGDLYIQYKIVFPHEGKAWSQLLKDEL